MNNTSIDKDYITCYIILYHLQYGINTLIIAFNLYCTITISIVNSVNMDKVTYIGTLVFTYSSFR